MLAWMASRLMSAVHREYCNTDTLFQRRNKRHIIPSILLRNLGVLGRTFASGRFIGIAVMTRSINLRNTKVTRRPRPMLFRKRASYEGICRMGTLASLSFAQP
jgi:hypothetical protein